jgi:hypothetical protein
MPNYSHWTTAADAHESLAISLGEVESASLIVEECRQGRLSSVAERLNGFVQFADRREVIGEDWHPLVGIRPWLSFWLPGHARFGEHIDEQRSEQKSRGLRRPDEVIVYRTRADWLSGGFTMSISGRKGMTATLQAVGVRFDSDAIGQLAEQFIPQVPSDRPIINQSPAVVIQQPIGGPGRKQKYPWELAMAHVVAVANGRDGLGISDHGAPGDQAIVESILQQWFIDSNRDVPSETQVRSYAQKIMSAIDSERRSYSGKPII